MNKWYLSKSQQKDSAELESSVADLLRSKSHVLFLTAGGLSLICYYAALMIPAWTDILSTAFLITLVVVLTTALAVWALSRRPLIGHLIWLIGLAGAISLATYLLRQPAITYFFALLPMLAVLSAGWQVGLLTEGAVTVLAVWLYRELPLPGASTVSSLVIIAGGAFGGVLAWVATHHLLDATELSLARSEHAWRVMQEARDERLELKEIQQDLLHANEELARLSERLRASNLVAEEARRAKEVFAANVSHELRTPLNMILGFSEMIPRLSRVYGVELPPPLLADIGAIRRNSQHLAKLVDDILDLSSVEAGRLALTREWTSLPETIEKAVAAVQALFETKGLTLAVEYSSDLPMVFCDSTRIRQVMVNLLGNAGRFTDRGGVRIEARCEDGNLIVSVADTGPGIDRKDWERIFQPFQQLESPTGRSRGGTGLGLGISKQFVEMHGGKMWLESEVGVGTTIYFSLPVELPLPAVLKGADSAARWINPHSQLEARTRRSKAPAPRVVPRYVLVEESDEILKRLFSRYVDDVEVTCVRDVEDAATEVARSSAQALIVNAPTALKLPAAINRLPELPYGTPTITCWVPGGTDAARCMGVVRYLVKPIACDTLLSTLADLGPDVRTVLLVDDEPDALQLLSRMLTTAERRYRVLRAKSGQQALTLLRQRPVDAMVLDLVMPGMDGFGLLSEMSQDHSIGNIPVVVVSGRDPSGEGLVSDRLTVTCSGGLSVRNLIACIQAVSQVLNPSPESADRGSPEKHLA